jgi:hypothetical protein
MQPTSASALSDESTHTQLECRNKGRCAAVNSSRTNSRVFVLTGRYVTAARRLIVGAYNSDAVFVNGSTFERAVAEKTCA